MSYKKINIHSAVLFQEKHLLVISQSPPCLANLGLKTAVSLSLGFVMEAEAGMKTKCRYFSFLIAIMYLPYQKVTGPCMLDLKEPAIHHTLLKVRKDAVIVTYNTCHYAFELQRSTLVRELPLPMCLHNN